VGTGPQAAIQDFGPSADISAPAAAMAIGTDSALLIAAVAVFMVAPTADARWVYKSNLGS